MSFVVGAPHGLLIALSAARMTDGVGIGNPAANSLIEDYAPRQIAMFIGSHSGGGQFDRRLGHRCL